MKTVYLVRHAKAIPRDSGIDDFKRLLTAEGRKDARTMGKQLAKNGVSPDLLIASPADRALETAHIFAAQFKYPVQKILLRAEIYENADEILCDLLVNLDDRYQTVMLFGHDPAISQCAAALSGQPDIMLRTTGVAGLTFAVDAWNAIRQGRGTLIYHDFPIPQRKKVYRQARKIIAAAFIEKTTGLSEQFVAGSSAALKKMLAKTSSKFAKALLAGLPMAAVARLTAADTPSESVAPVPDVAAAPAALETTPRAKRPGRPRKQADPPVIDNA